MALMNAVLSLGVSIYLVGSPSVPAELAVPPEGLNNMEFRYSTMGLKWN
jgi:hypothetical protein